MSTNIVFNININKNNNNNTNNLQNNYKKQLLIKNLYLRKQYFAKQKLLQAEGSTQTLENNSKEKIICMNNNIQTQKIYTTNNTVIDKIVNKCDVINQTLDNNIGFNSICNTLDNNLIDVNKINCEIVSNDNLIDVNKINNVWLNDNNNDDTNNNDTNNNDTSNNNLKLNSVFDVGDFLKIFNMNNITSIITMHFINLITSSSSINIYKSIYDTISHNELVYENFNDQNINTTGSLIICNHLNMSDGLLLLSKFKKIPFTIIKKKIIMGIYKELFLNKIDIESLLKMFSIILYDNDNTNTTNETCDGKSVKKIMLEKISSRNNILLFPEGTLTKCQNKLLPFKLGGIQLAYDNNIPILPLLIYYVNPNHRFYNNIVEYNENNTLLHDISLYLAIYNNSGKIIVHHCFNGNPFVANECETFDMFYSRLHELMQTELTMLDIQYGINE